MTIHADIDASGRAKGFYSREIHGDAIPEGAIEISEAVHATWIQDTQRQRWDGTKLVPCDPPPPPPPTADQVRRRRDALLLDCDWTQVADAPLTEDEREEWRVYRQALRDVPQQPGFPAAVVWPEPPPQAQA